VQLRLARDDEILREVHLDRDGHAKPNMSHFPFLLRIRIIADAQLSGNQRCMQRQKADWIQMRRPIARSPPISSQEQDSSNVYRRKEAKK
jgi:hypothetical protein